MRSSLNQKSNLSESFWSLLLTLNLSMLHTEQSHFLLMMSKKKSSVAGGLIKRMRLLTLYKAWQILIENFKIEAIILKTFAEFLARCF